MAIVRNTIKFSSGGGADITVVANYSALPDPTTVSGQFYWCSASQGTSWLPGSLGGTYYNSGMYYSNGTTWEFLNVPYNATQSEVNAGTNNDKFVTSETLKNQNYLATIVYADAKVADSITDGVTTIAPSQNAVFDALALKQNNLVSGTNIKTINGTSVLGSGNIVIGGSSTTPIILKNNFTPNTLTAPITTETIVDNYDLGVEFLAVGESLVLNAELVKNVAVSGTANTFFYLSKVSNSIAIGDAVRIATSAGLGTGNGSVPIIRTFHRKSTSILSGRVVGTTALLSDALAISNIPINIINDATLSDYRFLIVSSTYSGTSAPNTIQTNIVLTKNPVV
jgi:hypothetical protein